MALTVSEWTRVNLGTELMCHATITGDGSTQTIDVPMGRITGVQIVYFGASGTPESVALTCSWSGSTITYSAAVSSSKVHQLFVYGTD